jgi:hypothetical protein
MNTIKPFADRIRIEMDALNIAMQLGDLGSATVHAACAEAFLEILKTEIRQAAAAAATVAPVPAPEQAPVAAPVVKRAIKRKKRGLTAAIRPVLEDIIPGGTAYIVPPQGFDLHELQACVSAYCSHTWGNGSYATQKTDDGRVCIVRS